MNISLPAHKVFPVKSAYIEEMEFRLGITFPVVFKNRMMKENGGQIKAGGHIWHLFPFFDELDIHRMINTCDHIGIITLQARKWVLFPQEAVVIGSNTAGDLLILLPEKYHPAQLAECIYSWNRQSGQVAKLAGNILLTVGK